MYPNVKHMEYDKASLEVSESDKKTNVVAERNNMTQYEAIDEKEKDHQSRPVRLGKY